MCASKEAFSKLDPAVSGYVQLVDGSKKKTVIDINEEHYQSFAEVWDDATTSDNSDTCKERTSPKDRSVTTCDKVASARDNKVQKVDNLNAGPSTRAAVKKKNSHAERENSRQYPPTVAPSVYPAPMSRSASYLHFFIHPTPIKGRVGERQGINRLLPEPDISSVSFIASVSYVRIGPILTHAE
ncbi:hypothetical protein TSAR_011558 [Trichomalopsis sarcophagae]|uniref:Uncharacterized protein n=1 Tax=Trichomalopsis sarcophagae TaxID=543379 RepID=A0A232EQL0_9HYME|nr:hypothetical protein TSAR_011558 [Trichomalopsis sarcophagae]